LEDAARREALDEVERARLRRLVAASVRRAGDWIAFLYSREQDYEADLFAIHLCRNAGFDLEAALDVPRLWTRRDETASGSPILGAILEHNRSTPPLERLKRLRHEVDGVLVGDAYGLRRFDPVLSEFVPAGECTLPAGRHGVVFIHGMGSRLETFVPLAELLDERGADDRLVLFGFQYPGDASLARVGQALTRELAAFGNDAERLDFICHSAGGLAFRWYAEVDSGRFRQAVFLGTPHGGSNLAALRDFLEVQQFVADLRLGMREAIENVAADGDGQIGDDLQPDSLFLRYLDRGRPDVDRYAIFRGRRHEGRRVLLLRASTGALRSALRRAAADSFQLGPFEDATDRWIDRLEVPDEILRGDLAVSLDSAALEGVERIETVRVSHHKLQRHPEVMDAVAEMVLAAP
jgi:pimeloyl-ACP methyl ester carboxylesterase